MSGLDTGAEPFTGAVLVNAQTAGGAHKTIIITGNSRGGTSFAASAVFRLGVPFVRRHPDEVSGRYEHVELRAAFQGRDEAGLRQIAAEFDEKHPSWAWKLPAIQFDFDFLERCIPNACFVFIFKEPMSIALRKMDLKGADPVHALDEVLNSYERMVDFARNSKSPVLLIGYDTAMANMEPFLADLAAFCNAPDYDPAAVIEAVRRDGANYYAPKGERVAGPGDEGKRGKAARASKPPKPGKPVKPPKPLKPGKAAKAARALDVPAVGKDGRPLSPERIERKKQKKAARAKTSGLWTP